MMEGKIILGPKEEFIYVQIFLIILGFISFFYYYTILPELNQNVRNFFSFGYTISLILFVMFYLLTVITEPGYLPHKNLLDLVRPLNIEKESDKKIIKQISGNPNFVFEQEQEPIEQ